MITDFELKNFGPINQISGHSLSSINLIIGDNGAGKTFLLKALYSALKSHESTDQSDGQRGFSKVLSNKLSRTFQTEKVGDLVSKGKGKRLQLTLNTKDNQYLVFSFGAETKSKITQLQNHLESRGASTVFLPSQEVLSPTPVILDSQLRDNAFAFDDTCLDLALALQKQSQPSADSDTLSLASRQLGAMLGGKIEFDTVKRCWVYKKRNSRYPISAVADGFKKIATFDILLRNRFINEGSIVFVDTPESALHPTNVVELLDVISLLAQSGVQFFIASHSYFVIKKLLLVANNEKMQIPVFVADNAGDWRQSCLLEDGLPENEIINKSIRLFEQEFTGSF